jgi:hypothetical protein
VSNHFNTPAEIDDPSQFEMPFGKYCGTSIAEVPSQYLRWMYHSCNFQYYPELQRAIEHRLGLDPDPQIRTGPPPQAQPPAQTPPAQPAQPVARVGQPNGHQARPTTGIDGFRQALDRCRREALLEFQDDPDLTELVEDLFARVRAALGV